MSHNGLSVQLFNFRSNTTNVHYESSCDEYECCDFKSFYPNILRLIGCRSLCSVIFSPSALECFQLVDNCNVFALFGFERMNDCGVKDVCRQCSKETRLLRN